MNQNIVDHQRSVHGRVLRLGHQVEQARQRVDDAVGRARCRARDCQTSSERTRLTYAGSTS